MGEVVISWQWGPISPELHFRFFVIETIPSVLVRRNEKEVGNMKGGEPSEKDAIRLGFIF